MNRAKSMCLCPSCGEAKSGVSDSRGDAAFGVAHTRRRRTCAACGEKWTTVEIPAGLFREMMTLLDAERKRESQRRAAALAWIREALADVH